MEEETKLYALLPNSIIPPKEQIADYAYSLLGDPDFDGEGSGLIVLNAINAFIEKYPDVPELQETKAACLTQLGHDSFFVSFFRKDEGANEVYHISELENLVLKYKTHPDLAWNLCSYLYSRMCASIASTSETQDAYIDMMKSLLEKLPDNKHVPNYYAEGLQVICEITNQEKNLNEHIVTLKALAEKYTDNEKVIVAYASICLLILHYSKSIEHKLFYFNEITKLSQNYSNIQNLLVLRIFALLYLVVEDVENREKYVLTLTEISKNQKTVTDILWHFDWETNYEHFSGLNKNKMHYCNNMQQIVEIFPDFPDFVLCHKGIFMRLIGENGKAYYRNDFFKILKDAAERLPEREDIQLLYAEGLMRMAHYGDYNKKEQYVQELKSLSEKYNDNNPDILAYYCKGLSSNFSYRKEDYYKTYLPVVEEVYRNFPKNESVCEAFMRGVEWLVREDLYNKEKNARKFSKAGDAEKYFPEIKKIARKFPENANIAELYSSALDTYYDYLPNNNAKKEAVEDAIRISMIHNECYLDTNCNCYSIIEKYYLELDNPNEEEFCFNEMKRVVKGDLEDHHWYISQTLEEKIEKQKNETDKERYRQMLKSYCLDKPNSVDSVWRYGMILNNKMKNLSSVEQKEIIYIELEQWTLSYPGNCYLLWEYATGIFQMAAALFEKKTENKYVVKLRDFAKKYPIIVYKAKLEENEQYKKIIQ